MPTVLLVRHGETDWNRSGQIMGAQPVPLNDHGCLQAHRLASFLRTRPIRRLYSSPVVRARQTAEIVGAALSLPLIVEAGLTEIGVGDWVGRYWRDLADAEVRLNFYTRPEEARPPGGETLREVQARAVTTVQRALAAADSGPIVMVSHADVLRTIVAHYLQVSLPTMRQMRIDHASVTALEITGSGADLLFLNHVPQSD
jgi:broad specificity phosphatase PhoE